MLRPPASGKNHPSEFAGFQIYRFAPEVLLKLKETRELGVLYSGSRKFGKIFE
jgi:hypothetical protein